MNYDIIRKQHSLGVRFYICEDGQKRPPLSIKWREGGSRPLSPDECVNALKEGVNLFWVYPKGYVVIDIDEKDIDSLAYVRRQTWWSEDTLGWYTNKGAHFVWKTDSIKHSPNVLFCTIGGKKVKIGEVRGLNNSGVVGYGNTLNGYTRELTNEKFSYVGKPSKEFCNGIRSLQTQKDSVREEVSIKDTVKKRTIKASAVFLDSDLSIESGNRNSELTRRAGHLAAWRLCGNRLHIDSLTFFLKYLNQRDCSEPLDDKEVEAIARSISRKERDKDRSKGGGPVIRHISDGDKDSNITEAEARMQALGNNVRFNEEFEDFEILHEVKGKDGQKRAVWMVMDEPSYRRYSEAIQTHLVSWVDYLVPVKGGKAVLKKPSKVRADLLFGIHLDSSCISDKAFYSRFCTTVTKRFTCRPFLEWMQGVIKSNPELIKRKRENPDDRLYKTFMGKLFNCPNDYKGRREDWDRVGMLYARTLMAGIVNRNYNPGCKFDLSPVLLGGKGCGKTEFYRIPFGPENCVTMVRKPNPVDMGVDANRGVFYMADEHYCSTEEENRRQKTFQTEREDKGRRAYDHRTTRVKRRSIMVKNADSLQPLFNDPAGNRRDIVFQVAPKHSDGSKQYWNMVRVFQDNLVELIVEAWVDYDLGVPPTLRGDEVSFVEGIADLYMKRDEAVEEAVENFTTKLKCLVAGRSLFNLFNGVGEVKSATPCYGKGGIFIPRPEEYQGYVFHFRALRWYVSWELGSSLNNIDERIQKAYQKLRRLEYSNGKNFFECRKNVYAASSDGGSFHKFDVRSTVYCLKNTEKTAKITTKNGDFLHQLTPLSPRGGDKTGFQDFIGHQNRGGEWCPKTQKTG